MDRRARRAYAGEGAKDLPERRRMRKTLAKAFDTATLNPWGGSHAISPDKEELNYRLEIGWWSDSKSEACGSSLIQSLACST
jgi:hypothetical protein